MTTGTSRKPPAALRDWGLAQLDLQPGMSNEEARRVVFGRLSDMDFMPPVAYDSALRAAGMAPADGAVNGPVFVPARRAVEEALRAEVEAFAAKYFSLPPELRIARYRELIAQADGMPAVTARLEGLGQALQVPCEWPAGRTPEVTELLVEVCRLFVLPRRERASRRLAFLRRCRTNWRQWQDAAVVVQAKIARVASLEPALFRELCTPGNREKARQKIARQRRRALQGSLLPRITMGVPSDSHWWIYIFIGSLVGLSRLFSGIYDHSPKSPPVRSSPVHSSPAWPAQEAERRRELNKSFVDIQSKLKQAEIDRAARRGQVPRDLAGRVTYPAEKTSSPPSNPPSKPSPPPLPTDLAEIRVAKSPEEAREMLRQLEEQRAQGGPRQKGVPRVEMQTLNLDQARELLRQLREQQAQSGPNLSRAAAISTLEKAIDEAARNSQKQP